MGINRRTVLQHFSLLATGLATGLAHRGANAAANKTIVVLGDSLSAEYGLPRGSGWVALLAERMAKEKQPYEVVNASISGDTTSGGRSRLPALLQKHRPAVLIIELGGNDMLRGLPLASSRDNLAAMIHAAQAVGAKVLLVGMQVPPNFGRAYVESFSAMYAELSRSERTGLVPFLLAGVAERPDVADWFQADRIHPLAKAHPLMLDNVWPALKKLL